MQLSSEQVNLWPATMFTPKYLMVFDHDITFHFSEKNCVSKYSFRVKDVRNRTSVCFWVRICLCIISVVTFMNKYGLLGFEQYRYWLHFGSQHISHLCSGYNYDLTSIRRPFRLTVYQRSLRSEWRNALAAVTLTYLFIYLFIYLGRSAVATTGRNVGCRTIAARSKYSRIKIESMSICSCNRRLKAFGGN